MSAAGISNRGGMMFALENKDRNFEEKDLGPGQYISRVGDLVAVLEPYADHKGRGWTCVVLKSKSKDWQDRVYKVNVKGCYDDYGEDGLDLIVKTENSFMGIFEPKAYRTRDGRKAVALHKLATDEQDSRWVVAVRNPDGREIPVIYIYTGQPVEIVGSTEPVSYTKLAKGRSKTPPANGLDIVDVWIEPPRVRTGYILSSFLDEMGRWPSKIGSQGFMLHDKPQPTNPQDHGTNYYVKVRIEELPE